mgnify:CR=1 FL=1
MVKLIFNISLYILLAYSSCNAQKGSFKLSGDIGIRNSFFINKNANLFIDKTHQLSPTPYPVIRLRTTYEGEGKLSVFAGFQFSKDRFESYYLDDGLPDEAFIDSTVVVVNAVLSYSELSIFLGLAYELLPRFSIDFSQGVSVPMNYRYEGLLEYNFLLTKRSMAFEHTNSSLNTVSSVGFSYNIYKFIKLRFDNHLFWVKEEFIPIRLSTRRMSSSLSLQFNLN